MSEGSRSARPGVPTHASARQLLGLPTLPLPLLLPLSLGHPSLLDSLLKHFPFQIHVRKWKVYADK